MSNQSMELKLWALTVKDALEHMAMYCVQEPADVALRIPKMQQPSADADKAASDEFAVLFEHELLAFRDRMQEGLNTILQKHGSPPQ